MSEEENFVPETDEVVDRPPSDQMGTSEDRMSRQAWKIQCDCRGRRAPVLECPKSGEVDPEDMIFDCESCEVEPS